MKDNKQAIESILSVFLVMKRGKKNVQRFASLLL